MLFIKGLLPLKCHPQFTSLTTGYSFAGDEYFVKLISLHHMEIGTVKFFNESKGYGFIVSDESKKEVFVHHSGLLEKVRENDRVEFEEMDGRKGVNAVNVKRVQ